MGLLSDILGVQVSLGALSAVEARVSDAVQPAVDAAWDHVGQAGVKHTDGTSWYQSGITMALWTGEGERLAALDLADVDLPAAIVQSLARQAAEEQSPVGASYQRVPGAHLAAAVPLADGRVLTIGVGPRTRLVPPTRVGRFLAGGGGAEAPYRLAMSPPEATLRPPSAAVSWRRAGWMLHGERVLALPGGGRHVHVQVDLRGPSALLQRGFLVLLFDIAVLALLWLGIELVGGRLAAALRRKWPRTYRSLRVRLTAGLALFFVIPTVAIAAWSYERLGDEFRRSRELLLRQTLRDAGGRWRRTRGIPGSRSRRWARGSTRTWR